MHHLFVLSAARGRTGGREGIVDSASPRKPESATSYGRITANPGGERAERPDPYFRVVASARGRQEKSRSAGQTSG
jgi:hypothetical protein